MVSLFPHPASFRFRLTTDTLAFGYLLPATGRIRVFHPLETCAAGRTHKRTRFGTSVLNCRPNFVDSLASESSVESADIFATAMKNNFTVGHVVIDAILNGEL